MSLGSSRCGRHRALLRPLVRVVAGATLVLGAIGNLAAENIILMIGDGMGPEQIRAAGMYAHGEAGTLFMETAPVRGWVRTDPAIGSPTDSAAAATAMATGQKVANGVLSMRIPGDGRPLMTILEEARDAGWSTGLVTTTYITHATPAAFGAHVGARADDAGIAEAYLTVTRPDVLMGGGRRMLTRERVTEAGYRVVTSREELLAVRPEEQTKLAGLFGLTDLPYEADGLGDLPHLSEMARVALSVLARNPRGFFLMIEGGRIDHAGHANLLEHNIKETLEFDRTVQLVVEWATAREDTRVIVTADHETGGLKILANKGQGNLPDVEWGSKDHTAVDVPLFAWGPGTRILRNRIDNTTIHAVMQGWLRGAGGGETDNAEPAGASGRASGTARGRSLRGD